VSQKFSKSVSDEDLKKFMGATLSLLGEISQQLNHLSRSFDQNFLHEIPESRIDYSRGNQALAEDDETEYDDEVVDEL